MSDPVRSSHKTDEGKKLLRIASELYAKQRFYSLPPQVPEQRVRTLQKAFISTERSSASGRGKKGEARDRPDRWARHRKMVNGLYEIEPAVVSRVKQIFESK